MALAPSEAAVMICFSGFVRISPAAKTPAKRDVDQKTAGLSCDRQPMRPSFLRQNESEQQRPIAIHAS